MSTNNLMDLLLLQSAKIRRIIILILFSVSGFTALAQNRDSINLLRALRDERVSGANINLFVSAPGADTIEFVINNFALLSQYEDMPTTEYVSMMSKLIMSKNPLVVSPKRLEWMRTTWGRYILPKSYTPINDKRFRELFEKYFIPNEDAGMMFNPSMVESYWDLCEENSIFDILFTKAFIDRGYLIWNLCESGWTVVER